MNQSDGKTIMDALKEYVGIEIEAKNTMTKYGGSAILTEINTKLNQIIIGDIEKEKLWEAKGKEWLEEKKKKEDEERKNKNKKENIIDASKTISSKLLDEKLKKDTESKGNKKG